ncbi:NADH dehydrogenase [ubiquinone] 1 beta subcomplex subunit 7-like [Anneissia japonica]|uniref:NADH dehydrogenase [ubiquinone] 1 beta subcomplex subunit 7-like n=1 Tax=Anneissia japonica TaxID=1529436 RepID=UPI0014257887|nr:NADH dehydrogenase [ubiquinone] 1 beta subcomplex subunit 7-like [Anneissia japonica]
MGHYVSHYFTHPDTAPKLEADPTFDPLYGFPNGREERVMIATEEEMDNANLSWKDRDYCAHTLIAYKKCRRDDFPLGLNCGHAKHAYDQCEFEDYVLRMKEFEREKRLLERAKRIKLKAEKEAL